MGRGIAAPLASEMMEWKKNKISSVKYSLSYGWMACSHDAPFENDKSLPNALMKMCLWEKNTSRPDVLDPVVDRKGVG
jgi:hypothetical protein